MSDSYEDGDPPPPCIEHARLLHFISMIQNGIMPTPEIQRFFNRRRNMPCVSLSRRCTPWSNPVPYHINEQLHTVRDFDALEYNRTYEIIFFKGTDYEQLFRYSKTNDIMRLFEDDETDEID